MATERGREEARGRRPSEAASEGSRGWTGIGGEGSTVPAELCDGLGLVVRDALGAEGGALEPCRRLLLVGVRL
jgi:hypothetical protein